MSTGVVTPTSTTLSARTVSPASLPITLPNKISIGEREDYVTLETAIAGGCITNLDRKRVLCSTFSPYSDRNLVDPPSGKEDVGIGTKIRNYALDIDEAPA
ncbi:hypothetical protein FHL15_006190 [Xylaria flabelliformis]|uniref:Uncharacterized protein n=1 Tax=Xylaria flabelliformis TaxID=2512241 RepID=A0A553HXV7_9PEZI|nr:hypothetical protein FHL15_006190 [Xylaria flabelliformis]